MRTNTTDTAKAITTWINDHHLFKWGAMCDKVGLDKANFHRTLASDTPRIKEEYLNKIIDVVREYGYKDAEDKADEKLKEELANDQEFTEILEDINKSTPKKKSTFKTGIAIPQSEQVKLNDLNTQSKGKTKDFTEKKKTNYPINTMPVRGKNESAIDFAGRKSDWKKNHLK